MQPAEEQVYLLYSNQVCLLYSNIVVLCTYQLVLACGHLDMKDASSPRKSIRHSHGVKPSGYMNLQSQKATQKGRARWQMISMTLTNTSDWESKHCGKLDMCAGIRRGCFIHDFHSSLTPCKSAAASNSKATSQIWRKDCR